MNKLALIVLASLAALLVSCGGSGSEPLFPFNSDRNQDGIPDGAQDINENGIPDNEEAVQDVEDIR